jgi:hypothetical protein
MSQTDDIIKSTEELAGFAQDLSDIEVGEIGKLIGRLQRKFAGRLNTPENLDQLRDEVVTRLAEEMGILATLDPTPCFHGEPPIVEIIGKVSGHSFHKDGFDHERKYWEVQQANRRGEAYLGQKEKSKG